MFVPFHYGYWDTTGAAPADDRPGTAANETTITDWDPVSKQPLFKTAAARVTLADVAGAEESGTRHRGAPVSAPAGLRYALGRLHAGEGQLHADLLRVAEQHRAEHEIHHVARDLARWSADHVQILAEHANRRGIELHDQATENSALGKHMRNGLSDLIGKPPGSGVLVLEDVRQIYLQAADNSLSWEMLAQLAQAQRDEDTLQVAEKCHPQNLRQLRWANTMIKTQSPQILTGL